MRSHPTGHRKTVSFRETNTEPMLHSCSGCPDFSAVWGSVPAAASDICCRHILTNPPVIFYNDSAIVHSIIAL